jgi:hypothetical protein
VEGDEEEAPVPLEAIVDPKLLSLVRARFRPEIVRRHTLPTWVGELPYHLEPADWRAGYLSVVDGTAPVDVREAMREMTPRAQLRDLFRPVFSQAPVALELNRIDLDPGGRNAWSALRAALRREPVPVVTRSIELLAEEKTRWREFVDGPWQPVLRDDEPRKPVFVVIEPSLSA